MEQPQPFSMEGLSVHAFRRDSPDMLCTTVCSHISGQVLKIFKPLMTTVSETQLLLRRKHFLPWL